jgi:hypothetical protein
MKKRVTIYCHYHFDKNKGNKIGFLIRNSDQDSIIIEKAENIGIEQLEILSIKKALEHLNKNFLIEIFMMPGKLSKKILKGKEPSNFKKLLLSNSSYIYWLRERENNVFISKLIKKFNE